MTLPITADQYADWLQHPVTEAVFAALKVRADQQPEGWRACLNYPDDFDLAELNRERLRFKYRAETLRDVTELTFEEVEALSE